MEFMSYGVFVQGSFCPTLAKLAKGRGTSIASSVTELSSGARARAVAVRSKVGIQASNQSTVDVCSELGQAIGLSVCGR